MEFNVISGDTTGSAEELGAFVGALYKSWGVKAKFASPNHEQPAVSAANGDEPDESVVADLRWRRDGHGMEES